MFSKSIGLIIRAVQLLFAIIVLALAANIIATSYWNDTNIDDRPGNPAAVNYPIFIGIFTILCSVFYLLEAYFDWRGQYEDSRYVTLALEALNTIFWFTGAVALSALMGVHSCNNSTYTLNNVITRDAANTKRRCQEAQAVTAFLWFGFLACTFTTAAAVLYTTYPELVLHKNRDVEHGSQGAPPMAAATPDLERNNDPPRYSLDRDDAPPRGTPGGRSNGGNWIGD